MKRSISFKLIALVLAILLLPIAETALAYGVYEDAARDAVPKDGELSALAQAMNAPGSYIEVENNTQFPWIPYEFDGAPCGRSVAALNSWEYSYSAVTVEMEKGDELYFEFYVDAHSVNGWFECYVNGTPGNVCSGHMFLHSFSETGSVVYSPFAWHSYSFVVSESGTYRFVFDYWNDEFDETGLGGKTGVDGIQIPQQCVYVRNLCIRSHEHTELDDVLNAPGCAFEYASGGDFGVDPWEVSEKEGLQAGKSMNQDDMSWSWLHIPALRVSTGDTLSFEYYIDSSARRAGLELWEGSQFHFNLFYNYTDHGVFEDPQPYGRWRTFTWTAGEHYDNVLHNFDILFFLRETDSSTGNCAYVRNIRVTRAGEEPVPASGDVNGDGYVDASDALLTMRYAMGIIDLAAEQLFEADVNGDGNVDNSDALIIMRKAMGLIDN